MSTSTEILIKELRRQLRYEPETGKLFWKISGRKGKQVGKEAGWANDRGYRRVKIGRGAMCTQHIIWLLEKGVLPREIDHINRDPTDNRIVNLRDVSREENIWNSRKRSTNTSGTTGVYRHQKGMWEATIRHKGEQIYLGHYSTFELAVAARKTKEIELGRNQP